MTILRTYESMLILRPNLSKEETEQLLEKFQGVISEGGGETIKVDRMGKRRIAYEMKKQQEAFQKAQKEAFERHQEAMKNNQVQAPVAAPAAYQAPTAFQVPAHIEARRAEMKKQMEERRKEADARHEAFIKRMNEARAPQAEDKTVATEKADKS